MHTCLRDWLLVSAFACCLASCGLQGFVADLACTVQMVKHAQSHRMRMSSDTMTTYCHSIPNLISVFRKMLWSCAEPAVPISLRQTSAKPAPEMQSDEEDQSDAEDSNAGSEGDVASPDAADNGKVVLMLQCKEGKMPMRISKQKALSKLFEPFKQHAIQKGWLPNAKAGAVKFMFDGDKIGGSETAEGLDCDNDDIIEVQW